MQFLYGWGRGRGMFTGGCGEINTEEKSIKLGVYESEAGQMFCVTQTNQRC